MRGGERVLLQLVRLYPQADLYTLFHVPGAIAPEIEALRLHTSPLSRLPGAGRHYRKLLPLYPWAIERFDLHDYDLVLSCSHAVAKSVVTGPATPHLAYCLTPMRYIWDQTDAYLGRGVRRALAAPLLRQLRRFDLRTSTPDRVTRFVATSSAVAERIHRHYGRCADVVHPPVEVERIRPNGKAPEDFYLLVGGFLPYKAEQLAIDAFGRLGRRLVVAGDGPARSRLESRAPRQVEFTGWVPDCELADLYARCRALIYPQEEDFGLVAVEAQAAGRPVIAFGRGGARDTVVPWPDHETDAASARKATGVWFERQSSDSLIAAVERFEKREHLFDAKHIRAWAERFEPARFRGEIERRVGEMAAQADAR